MGNQEFKIVRVLPMERAMFCAYVSGDMCGVSAVEVSQRVAEHIPLKKQKRFIDKWTQLGFYKPTLGLFTGEFDYAKLPYAYAKVLKEQGLLK